MLLRGGLDVESSGVLRIVHVPSWCVPHNRGHVSKGQRVLSVLSLCVTFGLWSPIMDVRVGSVVTEVSAD